MEFTSPWNSLIGHSLKWRCCSLVWTKSLLTKISFDPLGRDQSSFRPAARIMSNFHCIEKEAATFFYQWFSSNITLGVFLLWVCSCPGCVPALCVFLLWVRSCSLCVFLLWVHFCPGYVPFLDKFMLWACSCSGCVALGVILIWASSCSGLCSHSECVPALGILLLRVYSC